MNPELLGDSFLIVGFGREGESAYRFIRERLPKARIGIADRGGVADVSRLGSEIEVYAGEGYLSRASTFSTIIRSPGVSLRELGSAIGSGTYCTSATNIFFAECPGVIIGVTGTKGKSTTSSMIASIAKRAFPDTRLVGNIGAPMLDHLVDATSETRFVVELSSYQLEDLRRSPHVAVLLNIVPEHLDYHGGFGPYRAAKLAIERHQRATDILVCNPWLVGTRDLPFTGAGKRVYFTDSDHGEARVAISGTTIVVRDGETNRNLIPLDQLPVRGPGNVQNALAAIACAVSLGVDDELIREGLAEFSPLEHRLEFVGERHGIRFYNDSLATIPEALENALSALGDDVETVIAGGFDRGLDMTRAGVALANSKVRNVILFPTTGAKIWAALIDSAPGHSCRRFDVDSMESAVQVAYDYTSPGRICVMSPASSSFSIFRDYRERGDRFKLSVRELSPSESSERAGKS